MTYRMDKIAMAPFADNRPVFQSLTPEGIDIDKYGDDVRCEGCQTPMLVPIVQGDIAYRYEKEPSPLELIDHPGRDVMVEAFQTLAQGLFDPQTGKIADRTGLSRAAQRFLIETRGTVAFYKAFSTTLFFTVADKLVETRQNGLSRFCDLVLIGRVLPFDLVYETAQSSLEARDELIDRTRASLHVARDLYPKDLHRQYGSYPVVLGINKRLFLPKPGDYVADAQGEIVFQFIDWEKKDAGQPGLAYNAFYRREKDEPDFVANFPELYRNGWPLAPAPKG